MVTLCVNEEGVLTFPLFWVSLYVNRMTHNEARYWISILLTDRPVQYPISTPCRGISCVLEVKRLAKRSIEEPINPSRTEIENRFVVVGAGGGFPFVMRTAVLLPINQRVPSRSEISIRGSVIEYSWVTGRMRM